MLVYDRFTCYDSCCVCLCIEISLSILEEVQSMKVNQWKLQDQMNTLENRCKATEEKYSELISNITRSEINLKREIYDISKHYI